MKRSRARLRTKRVSELLSFAWAIHQQESKQKLGSLSNLKPHGPRVAQLTKTDKTGDGQELKVLQSTTTNKSMLKAACLRSIAELASFHRTWERSDILTASIKKLAPKQKWALPIVNRRVLRQPTSSRILRNALRLLWSQFWLQA